MTIGEVLPTNEARARLNAIAASFDADGATAKPVVFGRHRRAQGVIVSWELWQRIAPAVEDMVDAELATRRLAAAKGRWLTRAEVDAEPPPRPAGPVRTEDEAGELLRRARDQERY